LFLARTCSARHRRRAAPVGRGCGMKLYHFTASCNLERIVNEGHIWAVNSETNNHMSLGIPVVWLTERPDDCIATDSDIKQLRKRGYEDLAAKIEGRGRQMFAGCPDDPEH